MLMLARYILIVTNESYRVHFADMMCYCTELMLGNSEIVFEIDDCMPQGLPTCRTPVQQVRIQMLSFSRSL
jgi:hypothetical protein